MIRCYRRGFMVGEIWCSRHCEGPGAIYIYNSPPDLLQNRHP